MRLVPRSTRLPLSVLAIASATLMTTTVTGAVPAFAAATPVRVTATTTERATDPVVRAGADAYFTKGSFDQDRLLATVRRVAGMEAP